MRNSQEFHILKSHLKKLSSLLANYKHIGRYRHIRLPLRNSSDWCKVPLVTRSDLKDFSPKNSPSLPFNIAATSGSTNSRLLVYQSKECYETHLRRQVAIYSSIGLKRGDICLNLCSYSMSGGGRIMEAAFKELGLTVIPYGELHGAQALADVTGIIRSIKPTIVNSYVNQIYDVFNKLGSGHSIRKCIINGEPIYPAFRRLIEKMSGSKVYDNYGSMEFSGFAIAQSHGQEYMKIFDDGLLIEVLKEDGRPSRYGSGRIVVTDTTNTSLPLIRYLIGDEVEIVKKPDGNYIKVFGRSDDHILLHGEVESKREIEEAVFDILGHPSYFFTVSKITPSCKDNIELNILKKNSYATSLEKSLKARLPFLCRIRWVDSDIPRTSTGKFRHFLDTR